MIDIVYSHIVAYLNRPTVVMMDIVLLALAIISVIGVVVLRRRISDLSVAIKQIQHRITKGQD